MIKTDDFCEQKTKAEQEACNPPILQPSSEEGHSSSELDESQDEALDNLGRPPTPYALTGTPHESRTRTRPTPYFIKMKKRMLEDGEKPGHPPSAFCIFSERRRNELRRVESEMDLKSILEQVRREWKTEENKQYYQTEAKIRYHEFKQLTMEWKAKVFERSQESRVNQIATRSRTGRRRPNQCFQARSKGSTPSHCQQQKNKRPRADEPTACGEGRRIEQSRPERTPRELTRAALVDSAAASNVPQRQITGPALIGEIPQAMKPSGRAHVGNANVISLHPDLVHTSIQPNLGGSPFSTQQPTAPFTATLYVQEFSGQPQVMDHLNSNYGQFPALDLPLPHSLQLFIKLGKSSPLRSRDIIQNNSKQLPTLDGKPRSSAMSSRSRELWDMILFQQAAFMSS